MCGLLVVLRCIICSMLDCFFSLSPYLTGNTVLSRLQQGKECPHGVTLLVFALIVSVIFIRILATDSVTIAFDYV
jgi:hypothetical protein